MKVLHINRKPENIIDKRVKWAVANTETIAPINAQFDKASIWLQINTRMSKVTKETYIWALAIAASISMTIASGISLMDINKNENIQKEVFTIVPSPTEEVTETLDTRSSNRLAFSKINALPIETETQPMPLLEMRTTRTHQIEDPQHIGSLTSFTPILPRFLDLDASVGFNQNGILPEVGLKVNILNFTKNGRKQKFSIGSSAQLAKTNFSERKNTTNTKLFVFATATYENLDSNKTKGWIAQAGYLLNPDGNLYKDTTVRLSLKKQFSKHITIGPDITLTNNLKKVYTGFTLTFI